MFIMVAKSPRDVEAGVGPVILDALADPVGPLLRGTLILGHPEPNVVELYMLVQVDDRVNLVPVHYRPRQPSGAGWIISQVGRRLVPRVPELVLADLLVAKRDWIIWIEVVLRPVEVPRRKRRQHPFVVLSSQLAGPVIGPLDHVHVVVEDFPRNSAAPVRVAKRVDDDHQSSQQRRHVQSGPATVQTPAGDQLAQNLHRAGRLSRLVPVRLNKEKDFLTRIGDGAIGHGEGVSV